MRNQWTINVAGELARRVLATGGEAVLQEKGVRVTVTRVGGSHPRHDWSLVSLRRPGSVSAGGSATDLQAACEAAARALEAALEGEPGILTGRALVERMDQLSSPARTARRRSG